MGKIYRYIYYAIYQYCLNIWKFGKDWPEFYSVIIVSILMNFFVSTANFISIETIGYSFLGEIAKSEILSWMPLAISRIWHFFVIFLLNVYYFLVLMRWKECVKEFDGIEAERKRKRYVWVGLGAALIFISYVLSAYTVSS